MRAEEVEIYYDPGDIFSGLLRTAAISDNKGEQQGAADGLENTHSCPFSK